MGMRAGNVTRFLPRLLIFLLFCLTRAVLMAEGFFLSDGKDMPPRSRVPSEILTPQAMEAIFADGCGHQRFNLVAHRQPGKIILWDEGPASVAKSVSVGVNIKNWRFTCPPSPVSSYGARPLTHITRRFSRFTRHHTGQTVSVNYRYTPDRLKKRERRA
jgi:hypothetical protein